MGNVWFFSNNDMEGNTGPRLEDYLHRGHVPLPCQLGSFECDLLEPILEGQTRGHRSANSQAASAGVRLDGVGIGSDGDYWDQQGDIDPPLESKCRASKAMKSDFSVIALGAPEHLIHS